MVVVVLNHLRTIAVGSLKYVSAPSKSALHYESSNLKFGSIVSRSNATKVEKLIDVFGILPIIAEYYDVLLD